MVLLYIARFRPVQNLVYASLIASCQPGRTEVCEMSRTSTRVVNSNQPFDTALLADENVRLLRSQSFSDLGREFQTTSFHNALPEFAAHQTAYKMCYKNEISEHISGISTENDMVFVWFSFDLR